MKIMDSKLFIAALSFIFGAGIMFSAQKLIQTKPRPADPVLAKNSLFLPPMLDQFFDDAFFEQSHDPFKQMQKMRKKMLTQFDSPMAGGTFDSWFTKRFGGGAVSDIVQREDGDFIYYVIAVEGLRPENLNVKVMDGQLSISGQVESKSDDSGHRSYLSSRFHRSFPLPAAAKAGNFTVEQKKDKVVVKFSKAKKEFENS